MQRCVLRGVYYLRHVTVSGVSDWSIYTHRGAGVARSDGWVVENLTRWSERKTKALRFFVVCFIICLTRLI